jgi:hypothetical protein
MQMLPEVQESGFTECLPCCAVPCRDLQVSKVHISLQFRPVLPDVSQPLSCCRSSVADVEVILTQLQSQR